MNRSSNNNKKKSISLKKLIIFLFYIILKKFSLSLPLCENLFYFIRKILIRDNKIFGMNASKQARRKNKTKHHCPTTQKQTLN